MAVAVAVAGLEGVTAGVTAGAWKRVRAVGMFGMGIGIIEACRFALACSAGGGQILVRFSKCLGAAFVLVDGLGSKAAGAATGAVACVDYVVISVLIDGFSKRDLVCNDGFQGFDLHAMRTDVSNAVDCMDRDR